MLPLHPAVVHAPLGIAVAVPFVLVALTVALYRGNVPQRALLVGALLQAVVVGGGLVALATGNAEEDRVERVVAEAAIERHEALATAFVAATAVALAITLAAALLTRWSRGLAVAATVGSISVLALGVAVGHAGGQLVYAHGAASVYASSASGGAPAGGNHALARERDDD